MSTCANCSQDRAEPGLDLCPVCEEAMRWDEAVSHVREAKSAYDGLIDTPGVNVTFALSHINSLLTRYANGERTARLYDEMIHVE